jgi:hypothetical protein
MPTLSLRGVGQAIAGSRTLRAKVLLREFYEFIILFHSFILMKHAPSQCAE